MGFGLDSIASPVLDPAGWDSTQIQAASQTSYRGAVVYPAAEETGGTIIVWRGSAPALTVDSLSRYCVGGALTAQQDTYTGSGLQLARLFALAAIPWSMMRVFVYLFHLAIAPSC